MGIYPGHSPSTPTSPFGLLLAFADWGSNSETAKNNRSDGSMLARQSTKKGSSAYSCRDDRPAPYPETLEYLVSGLSMRRRGMALS